MGGRGTGRRARMGAEGGRLQKGLLVRQLVRQLRQEGRAGVEGANGGRRGGRAVQCVTFAWLCASVRRWSCGLRACGLHLCAVRHAVHFTDCLPQSTRLRCSRGCAYDPSQLLGLHCGPPTPDTAPHAACHIQPRHCANCKPVTRPRPRCCKDFAYDPNQLLGLHCMQFIVTESPYLGNCT